jgi:RNA polymerase sigma factor (sigma-70 family)
MAKSHSAQQYSSSVRSLSDFADHARPVTAVAQFLSWLADPAPRDDESLGRPARSASGGHSAAPPAASPTDSALIEAVRDGNTVAFTLLVTRYAEPLARYAGHLVGNQSIADELVQDALFAVWERRTTLDIHGAPRPFLYGIVRNVCSHWLRRERVEARYQTAEHAIAEPALPGSGDDAELHALEGDVGRVIGALSPKVREVITLRLRDELTYPEIASVLGVSVKTIESHMTVALRTLRDELRRLGWMAHS